MLRTGIWIALLATVMGMIALASQADEREEYCGWVYPVSAYRADIAGLSIELPKIGQISVNKGPITSVDKPQSWEDSANYASVARAGDGILVMTYETDCVDFDRAWIHILNKDGTLRLSQQLWDAQYHSGFIRQRDRLLYWSEWFCDVSNSERKPKSSYVYILADGAKTFVKEDRPTQELCTPTVQTQMRVNSIIFGRMVPIIR
ncbi:hypothetical protein [Asticcacaulis sp.]|uniref:hypothetical protein n=1 Tax=Asticcacaulis sp. TaxID=1872648 RepID=UPI00260D300A|nr:hypothetical protein [Asticcacaulis sp.]